MRIGYIGLGSQGAGMAEMIARSEHDLVVWARREGVVDPYVALGVEVAASPADLAARCDIVGTCVMADADVIGLARDQGMLAAMRPGSVFVNQATISPQTSILLGELGSEHDVLIVDAPVSGSSSAARAKSLLVLASGEDTAIDAAQPMFDTYGKVIRCGALGGGQVAKLINNAVYYANSELVTQALAFAQSAGIGPEQMRAVLAAGSGASFALASQAALVDPNNTDHILGLVAKDVALFHALTPGETPTSDLHRVAEGMARTLRDIAERKRAGD